MTELFRRGTRGPHGSNVQNGKAGGIWATFQSPSVVAYCGGRSMHRFILCSGIHGEAKALERLSWVADARRPEGILFAGGALAQSKQFASRWELLADCARF